MKYYFNFIYHLILHLTDLFDGFFWIIYGSFNINIVSRLFDLS